MAELLKIANWSEHFENNRTRELKKMDWVPIPTKQDGDGYTELVGHANGASHLGAWLAIIQVAAKCGTRGVLLRDGDKPHDSRSLARISRLPKAVFDEAIPRLVAIGWIETEVVGHQVVEEIPQEGAGIPQEGAAESQASRRSRAPATGNGREGKDTEGKDKTHVSTEPRSAAVQSVLAFPTVGESKSWDLEQDRYASLCDAFPDLDVLGECRKARSWCENNPKNRKTPGGMGKFLFSWMSRAQNNRRGSASADDPRGNLAARQSYLERFGDGEA